MPPLQKFIVHGQKKLQGDVTVSGSKNAALPILCAAVLSDEPSTISNVPDIADIHTLLKIFAELNIKTSFQNHELTIDSSQMKFTEITTEEVCSMRASILLLGPLLSRFKEAKMPFPGGCVLGKRSAAAHTYVLKALGAEVLQENQNLHLRTIGFKSTTIIMPEQSVTATENALMISVITPGKTEIKLAAAEPHVQDLCRFLNKMGAKITGIGTHHLIIEGVKSLHGAKHSVTGDYLEAGTFAIASLVTTGEITIKKIETTQLDSFWQKLEEVNAKYELKETEARIFPSPNLQAINMLRTDIYPSFH